jgi:hypothetical protein
MTRTPNTINLADHLYDLAALHCILLPEQRTDRSRALAAAADCFALARFCPSEEEVAKQFLDLATLLPADEADQPSIEQPDLYSRAESSRSRTGSTAGADDVANASPPDGLRTPAEAARKLRCSIKTLNGHISSGALRYVIIGHGKKHVRRMFTDADLDDFVANQTRKDVPCPSTKTRARHTGNLISSGEVIAFTAQPRPPPGGKRKR